MLKLLFPTKRCKTSLCIFSPSYSLMLLGLLIERFPPLFSLDADLVAFKLFDCCFVLLKCDVRAQ